MSETETDAQPADAQPSARESKRRPAVDLDRMTVAELTALRDVAEAKRLEKLDDAKDAVLAETRAKLAELGLTLEAALPTPASSGQAGFTHEIVPVDQSLLKAAFWLGSG